MKTSNAEGKLVAVDTGDRSIKLNDKWIYYEDKNFDASIAQRLVGQYVRLVLEDDLVVDCMEAPMPDPQADVSTLASLLIIKGVITAEEWNRIKSTSRAIPAASVHGS